jgi:hypothetical protein
MFVVLSFLVYSIFCYWVVFMDGADVLEGWKSFFLLGWFAASLTTSELRFYVGLSWMLSLVVTMIGLFARASP